MPHEKPLKLTVGLAASANASTLFVRSDDTSRLGGVS